MTEETNELEVYKAVVKDRNKEIERLEKEIRRLRKVMQIAMLWDECPECIHFYFEEQLKETTDGRHIDTYS